MNVLKMLVLTNIKHYVFRVLFLSVMSALSLLSRATQQDEKYIQVRQVVFLAAQLF